MSLTQSIVIRVRDNDKALAKLINKTDVKITRKNGGYYYNGFGLGAFQGLWSPTTLFQSFVIKERCLRKPPHFGGIGSNGIILVNRLDVPLFLVDGAPFQVLGPREIYHLRNTHPVYLQKAPDVIVGIIGDGDFRMSAGYELCRIGDIVKVKDI